MNITNCTSCGAPLPRNNVLCRYCGTRNIVDVQGYGNYSSVQPEHPRNCPGCQTEMKTIDIAGGSKEKKPFLIEQCPSCHGLFFDNEELQQLLDQKTIKVSNINKERLKEISSMSSAQKVVYRPCPVCSKLMNRTNFRGRSGVVVDQCKDHGFYLDSGELRQLLEWRRAGGHLAADRAKEIEEKERQRKQVLEDKQVREWQNEIMQSDRKDVFGDTVFDLLRNFFGR